MKVYLVLEKQYPYDHGFVVVADNEQEACDRGARLQAVERDKVVAYTVDNAPYEHAERLGELGLVMSAAVARERERIIAALVSAADKWREGGCSQPEERALALELVAAELRKDGAK